MPLNVATEERAFCGAVGRIEIQFTGRRARGVRLKDFNQKQDTLCCFFRPSNRLLQRSMRVHPRIRLSIVVLGVVTFTAVAVSQQDKDDAQSVRPGINDNFLNADLDVSQWLGRFEVESREVYASRERVLDACDIRHGQTIADIGAGTGFYSRLFSEAVGADGWVYAVDIAPRFLQHITHRARDDGVRNLTAVLCSDRSVNLPSNSIDVAFICDTYHHFEYPSETLASLHRALKVGGTLIVIDFERIPGESREFIINHVRAGKDVFQREIERSGFQFVDEVTIPTFNENYFLRFRKAD
jgi:ubiquinone/menaquinone biosynthesis C-methylase UbiE